MIYNLIIDVTMDYPTVPPKIRFQSPKIAMPCVDAQGWVDIPKIELVDISLANNEGMVCYFNYNKTYHYNLISICIC